MCSKWSATLHKPPRIAIGTAQFGLPYGIANRGGQVGLAQGAAILTEGRSAGVDTLDTAIAYGNSEQRLGEIGVGGWRIVTKLPAVPDGCADVAQWARLSLEGSLRRLGVTRIRGLLLHRSQDLLGPHAGVLISMLASFKEEGLVEAVGVSVYRPEELDPLWGSVELDLVQAPYNVLDRRISTSGWLARLHHAGVAVHARSVFLQGLLLMPRDQLPGWAHRWDALWNSWHGWLADAGHSSVAACLATVLAEQRFERAVVGIDSVEQLRQVLAAARHATSPAPESLATEDPDLTDPSRWSRL